MKIQVLDLAMFDLIEGYHFYEDREAGLGDYFLNNLYTDIDSLAFFGGAAFYTLSPLPSCPVEAIPIRNLLHRRRRHREGAGDC